MNQYATPGQYQFSSVPHTPPQGTPRPPQGPSKWERFKGWFTRKSNPVQSRVSQSTPTMKAFIADFLGAFLAGTIAYLFIAYHGDLPGDLAIGWYTVPTAFGLAFGLGTLLGKIILREAGHINPAITMFLMARKVTKPKQGVFLLAGQVAGWLLAAVLVSSIQVGEMTGFEGLQMTLGGRGVQIATAGANARIEAAHYGMPQAGLSDEILPLVGKFVLEAVLTFFLLKMVTLVSRRVTSPIVPGIGIGFAVGVLVWVGTYTSGGSLNPLTWIGAATLSWTYERDTFLLYCIAPLTAVPFAVLLARKTE